jgi:uncharacterized membrane protein
MRKWLLGMVLSLAFFLVGCEGSNQEYDAERFDVLADLQADGSLVVSETVVFNFEEGDFTYVFRDIPTDHTDGITDIEARIDGVAMPEGDGAGQVEIDDDGNPVRVRWNFDETSNEVHTFELVYRMNGVVQQEDNADLLRWEALPTEHEYEIDAASVRITYPENTELIESAKVESGSAGVESSETSTIYSLDDIEENESLTVALRFPPGSVINEKPDWQLRGSNERRLIPLWIGLSVVVWLMGLMSLFFFWQEKHPKAAKKDFGDVSAPPDSLSPALAGRLSSTSTGWQHAMATLFDLARRGILQIQEVPKENKPNKPDFIITRQSEGENLTDYEEGFLELLFDKDEEVKLSKLQYLSYSKRWKRFYKPLEETLKTEGLISEEAKRSRGQLLFMGAILLVAGVLLIIPMALFESTLGFSGLILCFAVVIFGLVLLIAGSAFKTLSTEGMDRAAAWDEFFKYLREVTQNKKVLPTGEAFETYLPYVATGGLLSRWVSYFKKKGEVPLPNWFKALPTRNVSENYVPFYLMMSTVSSYNSSASGSGAAAGGAAGGGSSGAG